MLVLALADLDACCGSPTSPPRRAPRRCSAPTAPSPRTWSRCARSPARRRARANLRRLLDGSAIVASHREGDPRVQDAYSVRCTPAGPRRRPRHRSPTCGGRRGRAALGDRQPDGAAGRARRVVRQLPRRAGRARLRLPRDRGRRRRRDQRAAHRPAARRVPLPRPAAVPRPRPGRRLGADDQPVHPGGDGGREPPPRRPGRRRLAADQRDAGGPRVDGVGGRAQAPHRASTTCAGSSPSSSPARRAGLELRAPLAPAAGTGAALEAVRAVVCRARARTGGWRPSSTPSTRCCARRRCSTRSTTPLGHCVRRERSEVEPRRR